MGEVEVILRICEEDDTFSRTRLWITEIKPCSIYIVHFFLHLKY